MDKPDISNLKNCIEDARLAAIDREQGPPNPIQFADLLGRLQAAQAKLSPIYREAVSEPLILTLQQLGGDGFLSMINQASGRARIMTETILDIAQSVLQRGEGFEPKALSAFQEVVSDLYDGFLSAEDRNHVARPALEVIPPLVKFGNPAYGPYTVPIDSTLPLGVKAGVVNLPPANARLGLLAWPALGHETAGHDILHAETGLIDELQTAIYDGLANDPETEPLAFYWSDRVDETASDVMGILNMGPAAAIGVIGLFRGLNAAFGGRGILRSVGPADDPHPADILRGFLAAATVRQLKFSQAFDWADLIEAETMEDVTTITLDGMPIDTVIAKKSAEIVSRVIASLPLKGLGNKAFGDIQNWRDGDEAIVIKLRALLNSANPLPSEIENETFAAHLVAATTMSALAKDANIQTLFQQMLSLLAIINERNLAFKALRIVHPGNIKRDRFYIPSIG
jgi:hypothetical protein